MGGDLCLVVSDLENNIIYVGWYKMKKPARKTYQKIESLFMELEKLIVEE